MAHLISMRIQEQVQPGVARHDREGAAGLGGEARERQAQAEAHGQRRLHDAVEVQRIGIDERCAGPGGRERLHEPLADPLQHPGEIGDDAAEVDPFEIGRGRHRPRGQGLEPHMCEGVGHAPYSMPVTS